MTDFKRNQTALSQDLIDAYMDQHRRGFLASGKNTSNHIPKFINQLIHESSPYLLQHACNPVQWLPWGDKAFQQSRRHQKPILLSIGYSTCHWCHVMEKESFEDSDIADVINRSFIPVKVDREERPDVDSHYMSALHLMGQQGGWPLTMFLTPELKPFFGGTYFPARDGDRSVRTGFLTILRNIDKVWQEEHERVISSSESLSSKLTFLQQKEPGDDLPVADVFDKLEESLIHDYDPENGGHGSAPKFPSGTPFRFLFRHYLRSGRQVCVTMAFDTLRAMASSGLYDQVGGGFHRYATDEAWSVPHFEKMLYDNALLAEAYLEAWQISKDPYFESICCDILDYVLRDMTLASGGFCSATDADSLNAEGDSEEGYYFTWNASELYDTLREFQVDQDVLAEYFGLRSAASLEGRIILSGSSDPGSYRKAAGLSERDFLQTIADVRQKLLEIRNTRHKPFRDDKIMVSWNGLMISALCKAYRVFCREDYLEAAKKSANLILSRLKEDGTLPRCFREERTGPEGCLSDYSFFMAGLLELLQVDPEPRWIEAVLSLDQVVHHNFEDKKNGGFFQTSSEAKSTSFLREKMVYDGAEPSGNSVAVLNLLKLSLLTSDQTYRIRAVNALKQSKSTIEKSPEAVPDLLSAFDFYLSDPGLFLSLNNSGSLANTDQRLCLLTTSYCPNDLFMLFRNQKDAEALKAYIPSLGPALKSQSDFFQYCKQNQCVRVSDSSPEFGDFLESQKRSIAFSEKN